MTVRRVTTGGISIAAEVTGSGPLVVLLHGFTGDHTTMSGLAESLRPHRTVAAVDLVGHGASDAPDSAEHYSMLAAATQLDALVSDLGADRADVVGYSLGGRVALSFAHLRPALVEQLVLIGASPGLRGSDATQRVVADTQLANDIERDGVEAFVDRWMGLEMWRSLEARIGTEAWAASRRQRLRNRAIGLANSLRGMGTGAMPSLHGDLAHLHVPTLLITGTEDLKFEEVARAMQAALPDARHVSIPGAGHAAHLEQPDLVAAQVLEFLGCG